MILGRASLDISVQYVWWDWEQWIGKVEQEGADYEILTVTS